MKRIDKLIFGFLFGISFPVLFALMALTIWFYFFQKLNVPYFILAGLIACILTDMVLLKKLINRALDLPNYLTKRVIIKTIQKKQLLVQT